MSKYHKPTQASPSLQTARVVTAEESIRPKPYHQPYHEEHATTITNKLYSAELTDNGAYIKQLSMEEYKDKESLPTRLLKNETGIYKTEDLSTPEAETTWHEVGKTADTVKYKAEDNKKVIIKNIKFHNTKYIIELELIFENKTTVPQEIYYKVYGGPGVIINEYIDPRYLSADIQTNENIFRKKPGSKGIKNRGCEILQGSPLWASSTGRYFSFIIKPEQEDAGAFVCGIDKNNLGTGVILGPIKLEPAGKLTRRYSLYAGPNDTVNMRTLGIQPENIINYGILNGIAQAIFKTLKFFHNIIGNYGLAIILLAFVISIILLPLTRKSLKSIKEMQKIQPEIDKIKKDYSDNPQKMNKEVMELYKRHKINPFGGCLPMLLQLPIFIALYNVFSRSVELKGASFLWIKDLSEPDAAFRLPFVLPMLGGYLNILPIIMSIAMVLQQKLAQPKGAEVSDQQRMMTMFMPVFMCIIFYNMPSGLVLYWLVNTVIMLILQEFVLKIKQPKPA
jgi:YidC/Oxa1 family membrane protein insertase